MKPPIVIFHRLFISLLIFEVATGGTARAQSSPASETSSATEHVNYESTLEKNRHTVRRIKSKEIPEDFIGGISYRDGRRVRHNEQDWLNAVIEDFARYPMEIKLFDPSLVVFRLATKPTILLIDTKWSTVQLPSEITSERSSRFDATYGYLALTRLIVSQKDHPYQVGCSINLLSNHVTALVSAHRYFRETLLNASRPSTASWQDRPIEVRNASFVANFTGGPPDQRIAFSIGNLVGSIGAGREDIENRLFVEDSELGGMASRLSRLFDPPPDDVADADSADLEMNVARIEDGLRIVATTPEAGPYHGWWLRLDSTHGEIDVKTQGEAVIKDVPDTGAIITVYAISPDGKIWHRTSRNIP